MKRAEDGMMRSRGLTAAGAIVLAGLALPVPVLAAAGPFDGLEGMWSGDGTLTYSSGTQERLTCRVQYATPSVSNLTQALRCTSDSYNFQINAAFSSANGKLTGNWSEIIENLSGSLTGSVANGHITGSLKGPGFTAQINVVTKGSTQSVDIQAPVDNIRGVSIQLRKSSQ